MRRKLITGLLTALSVTMVCPAAYASTEHYTDSSVVGADSGWSDWDAAWETTAADFTKVSLTPGADDTQLNFAWYSEKGDSDATPVVHFGTDKDNLETFEGTAGDVDQSLTGDTVYFDGMAQTIDTYHPDVIVLNCCEATMPMGRLIMNLNDVEIICKKAPNATIIATHLDSVNHALLSSDDVRAFAARKKLTQLHVPANGEWIILP